MKIYIVSKMVCDDLNDYRAAECPGVFSEIEKAKEYIQNDRMYYNKASGYEVDEVKEWTSPGGTMTVTVYFNGGIVEYRIDEQIIKEI